MTGPTISIVIPTCNRKSRLLNLLEQLRQSTYPIQEIIIVDAGDDKLQTGERETFKELPIQYTRSQRSVCIQRNRGIQLATSEWVFLCDDDIEIPPDYLETLIKHLQSDASIGAISGQWMQMENNEWTASYPVTRLRSLYWKYFFRLGIWGPIQTKDNGIKRRYERRGNHISKAGWPVNVNLKGDNVFCPVYSLGASLVRKDWLLQTAFDEVLDPHGIGDNYGVIMSFPVQGVHIATDTWVHHHREPANRLRSVLAYYRRILALDYFIHINKRILAKRRWLLWSLSGNLLSAVFSGRGLMAKATLKAAWLIMRGKNPYYVGHKKGLKVVEPAF